MIGRSSRKRGRCYGEILVKKTPGAPNEYLDGAEEYLNNTKCDSDAQINISNMQDLMDLH